MKKMMAWGVAAGLSWMLAGGAVQAQGGTPAKPQVVEVKLSEWSMGMADMKAKGTVEFDVVNEGKYPHVFTIEGMVSGKAVMISSAKLKAGEKTTLTVTLPAGTYNVYCPIPGHAAQGMVGTLVIE
ncbi:plastocyanin/azurin family copper-binding protein [Deinococcus sp.]|uniref:plastocyanin/azurin family copper-binding protein n=1 Tax=Deinococcus sp. TaxID=47478 RepID=UPI003CC601B1